MKYRLITPTALAIAATIAPKFFLSAASGPEAVVQAVQTASGGYSQIVPFLDKGVTIGVLLMFSFWFQQRLAEKDKALLSLTQEVSANNNKLAEALSSAVEILNRLTTKRHHE